MQSPKIILSGKAAKLKLIEGINELANAVKSTLGPYGRNAVINTNLGKPHVTKDGVTVAKSIAVKDPIANTGIQMVLEASLKSAQDAGDGTTTATVLTQAIVNHGIKILDKKKVAPNHLKQQLEEAVELVIGYLQDKKLPCDNLDMIRNISMVSSNGDESISNLITKAYETIGIGGTLLTEVSKSNEDSMTATDGLRFDKGYKSPHFINHLETNSVKLDDVSVLVTRGELLANEVVFNLLDYIRNKGGSLLIIVDEIDNSHLNMLLPSLRNVRFVMVEGMYYGERKHEFMNDVAILTGAKVVDVSEETLDGLKIALGGVESVEVNRRNTTLLGHYGNAKAIENHKKTLRTLVSNSVTEYDRVRSVNRLAMFSGGLAKISVGGMSEMEVKERKDRYDDATLAVQAAIGQGVLPGGVTALLRSVSVLDTSVPGHALLSLAIDDTFKQLCINSDVDKSTRLMLESEILANNNFFYGYNIRRGVLEDLSTSGILDPYLVTVTALKTSVSVSSMVLTTDVVVVEEPDARYKPFMDKLDTF